VEADERVGNVLGAPYPVLPRSVPTEDADRRHQRSNVDSNYKLLDF